MTCEHFVNGAVCGSTDGVRFYIPGFCCRAHTPAAVAGRLDHTPDPDRRLDSLRSHAGQVWSLQIQQHKGRTLK